MIGNCSRCGRERMIYAKEKCMSCYTSMKNMENPERTRRCHKEWAKRNPERNRGCIAASMIKGLSVPERMIVFKKLRKLEGYDD